MSRLMETPLAGAEEFVSPLVRQISTTDQKVPTLLTVLPCVDGKVAALPRQLTSRNNVPTIAGNTPVMPLLEAHFGGFFLPGGCA